MKVNLKTSAKEVVDYLSNIGIGNLNKKNLSTFCHLVFVDGKTRIFHFKEVMQLIETLNRDEFLDLYVTKFDGLLEGQKRTYFDRFPRSKFLNNYIDRYCFDGKIRGLYTEDYSSFINDLFLDINMGADLGVQTRCFEEIEVHIYDYLDKLEEEGSNIFFKKDMIKYVCENYKTVAPLNFDDQTNKARYLKILEDEGLIEVAEEYDRDIPEFVLKFQNQQTLEWREDTNSKFLNINKDTIITEAKADYKVNDIDFYLPTYPHRGYDYSLVNKSRDVETSILYKFNSQSKQWGEVEFENNTIITIDKLKIAYSFKDGVFTEQEYFSTRRYTSTPKKYLVNY